MLLIMRIQMKFLQLWWQITIPTRLRMLKVEVGNNVKFYGMPIISMVKGSNIRIGDRVVLCSDSRFTALGVNHPVVLRTLQPNAEIIIGSDSGMSGGTICAATQVKLGRECLIGANVTIVDTDFHSIEATGRRYNVDPQKIATLPIVIEDNVFIGTNAMILKGVTIGKNSVIGASSVVAKSIANDGVWAGNPARLLTHLKDLDDNNQR